MKIGRVVLAVAAAFAAPAAMAQSANPVTLYGRIFGSIQAVDATGAKRVDRRTRLEDESSLLGVRGTENLGAGLKAFFQLETVFRIDQNTSTFAARNSGVGLQGGFGQVLLGRWDSPYKYATYAADPWALLTLAGDNNILQDNGNFGRREQNVVQYWSPRFAGVEVRLAGTANEGKTSTACGSSTLAGSCNPHDMGASITYNRGALYLVYAYEQHKDPNATLNKEEGNALGGSFRFGPVKIGALYEEFKRNANTSANSRSKTKSWMGNVVWTLGNNQFIYQYMQSKDGQTKANRDLGVEEPDCKSNSLGYQYNFSKRTFVLAQYTKVDNNSVASCNFGANRLAISAGQDPQGASLGIRHIF